MHTRKSQGRISKRISTTISEDMKQKKMLSGRTYRQLINLGLIHIEMAPKIVSERKETQEKLNVMQKSLNIFRKDYYARKKEDLQKELEIEELKKHAKKTQRNTTKKIKK